MFGRLAAWIARHRIVEVPEQFVRIIQNFLNTLEGRPWPDRSNRISFCLTKLHDWSAWLAGAGMTLQGHTGPSAPHVFSFRRRGECQTGVLVEHPDCVAGEPRHGADVIMCCKQWMASPTHSQAPMVVFRARAVQALPSREPCVSSELRPMTSKYKGHIRKFLPTLRRAPYNLCSAADHLESWIQGILVDGLPMDVRACVLNAAPVGPVPLSAGVAEVDRARVPLDPPPGIVGLLTGCRLRKAEASSGFHDSRAAVVYGCAAALFANHDIGMSAAIQMGESCWSSLQTHMPAPACPELAAMGRARGGRGRGGGARGGAGRGRGRALVAIEDGPESGEEAAPVALDLDVPGGALDVA